MWVGATIAQERGFVRGPPGNAAERASQTDGVFGPPPMPHPASKDAVRCGHIPEGSE